MVKTPGWSDAWVHSYSSKTIEYNYFLDCKYDYEGYINIKNMFMKMINNDITNGTLLCKVLVSLIKAAWTRKLY